MRNFNTNTANEETWLTPPEIIRSLGEFDLDPCSPINRPWNTANNHYTINDDGLILPWEGRVWMNPPYGNKLASWMNKMALHKNGISLIFSRTDTNALHDYVFPFAESILFLRGRIKFYDINGIQAKNSANAPSILIAYGEYNSDKIEDSGLKGCHVYLNPKIFIIGISQHKTWKIIVGEAMEKIEDPTLNNIYDAVVRMVPERTRRNKHYKAKIRQTLQYYYNNQHN